MSISGRGVQQSERKENFQAERDFIDLGTTRDCAYLGYLCQSKRRVKEKQKRGSRIAMVPCVSLSFSLSLSLSLSLSFSPSLLFLSLSPLFFSYHDRSFFFLRSALDLFFHPPPVFLHPYSLIF